MGVLLDIIVIKGTVTVCVLVTKSGQQWAGGNNERRTVLQHCWWFEALPLQRRRCRLLLVGVRLRPCIYNVTRAAARVSRRQHGPHDVRQDRPGHLPALQVHAQERLLLTRL